MNILFIQKDIFAKPSIMALSAILKREGHECDLLIDELEKDIVSKALELKPNVIAFSITTSEHPWMNQTATAIREHFSGTIICGGPHPTLFPDIIYEEYLDALCIGEGDEAIVEFANAIQEGIDTTNIRNFVLKKDGQIIRNDVRDLIQDLDRLPFFDRQLYDKYKLYRDSFSDSLEHKIMRTSRGCPYNCTFCINSTYKQLYRDKGKIVRHRSVPNVIEELKEMARDPKLNYICFEDDSFTLVSRKWLFEFLQRYRDEIGIPFKIQTPSKLIDEEVARRLSEAKCYTIRFGIEAGNEHCRNQILKKGITDEEIFRAAHLAKKYGMKIQTFNIMGSPGETLEMCFETFEINRKIRPDFVWCSLLNPYPGTEIFKYALENNYIEGSQDYNDVEYSYFINSPIRMPNRKEIHNLQKLTYFCILLRLPLPIVKCLIKLPLTKLYSVIFGVTFFIGLYKVDKTPLFDMVKLSLKHWTKYLRQG